MSEVQILEESSEESLEEEEEEVPVRNDNLEEQKNDKLVDNENRNDEQLHKSRKRRRGQLNAIREQMEFYFSDANLLKDRFLMKLVKENPFVSLDTFLAFNKIKNIAKTTKEIAKSLSTSQVLQLNEDQTKVKRILEIPNQSDPAVQQKMEKCTMYVEGIPQNAGLEWLKKVFTHMSGGGVVQYISMPKYKRTRKIKEFAFIEFDSEESVQKCLKKFQNFGGVLGESSDPSKLTSVVSYLKEQEKEKNDSAKVSDGKEDLSKTNQPDKCSLEPNIEESDSLTDSSGCDEGPPGKRKKLEVATTNTDEEYLTAKSQFTENDDGDKILESEKKKKKIRKRSKNQKTKSRKLQLNHIEQSSSSGGTSSKTLNMDSDVRELKVLPKKDWKRLRNKYLDLQRKKITELKRKAWEAKQQQNSDEKPFKKINKNMSPIEKEAKKKNSAPLEYKNKSPINASEPLNFYCSVNEEEVENSGKRRRLNSNRKSESKTINVATENLPTFQFQSGIIIKIDLIEACTNVKSFKADLKQYETVKYIDIKEGLNQAYIRCDNPENANELIKKVHSAEMQCSIISGNDEKMYWEKINKDRVDKLNKRIPKTSDEKRPRRKRGREKIAKIVSSHIRFNDEDFQD